VTQADRRGLVPDRQDAKGTTRRQREEKEDSRRGLVPDRHATQSREERDDDRRGFAPGKHAAQQATRKLREEQDLAETSKEATETDSLKNSDVNGQVIRKA
jgi:hypothetical protein